MLEIYPLGGFEGMVSCGVGAPEPQLVPIAEILGEAEVMRSLPSPGVQGLLVVSHIVAVVGVLRRTILVAGLSFASDQSPVVDGGVSETPPRTPGVGPRGWSKGWCLGGDRERVPRLEL